MKNQIQTQTSRTLPIVKYGDPILRKKVEDINDFIIKDKNFIDGIRKKFNILEEKKYYFLIK